LIQLKREILNEKHPSHSARPIPIAVRSNPTPPHPQTKPTQQPHPSAAAMMEVTPEIRRRNRLVALACVAFAFSVYSYSIRRLKEVCGWVCLYAYLSVCGCSMVVVAVVSD
jgi:hypothetical protein